MRADSGFYTHDIVTVCGNDDVRSSITVPTAQGSAPSNRGHTWDRLDAHTLLDEGRSRRCRYDLHSLRQPPRRSAVRLIVRR